MGADKYPDAVDKRNGNFLYPDGQFAGWVKILLILSIVGIPLLLYLPIQRMLYGGVQVYGRLWLTPDQLMFSPNWIYRMTYRLDGEALQDVKLRRDAITKIERQGLNLILTTAERQYKIMPANARAYLTLLQSK